MLLVVGRKIIVSMIISVNVCLVSHTERQRPLIFNLVLLICLQEAGGDDLKHHVQTCQNALMMV